jgi:hypothetical protein
MCSKLIIFFSYLTHSSLFFLLDILRFDNTYSWTRNKKIMFYVEVMEPDDQEGSPASQGDFNFGTPV